MLPVRKGKSRRPGSPPKGDFRSARSVEVRLDDRFRVPRERDGSFRRLQGHGDASLKGRRLQVQGFAALAPDDSGEGWVSPRGVGWRHCSGNREGSQTGVRILVPGTRTSPGGAILV